MDNGQKLTRLTWCPVTLLLSRQVDIRLSKPSSYLAILTHFSRLLQIGDVVPADCRLYDAVNVSIDQAALTGESLPISKSVGDQCFSGSICKQGEAEGIVSATGANTFFGRAATLVGAENDSTGHMQAVLAKVSSLLPFFKLNGQLT